MDNDNYVGDVNHNGDTVLRQTKLAYEDARDLHFKIKQYMNDLDRQQEEIEVVLVD